MKNKNIIFLSLAIVSLLLTGCTNNESSSALPGESASNPDGESSGGNSAGTSQETPPTSSSSSESNIVNLNPENSAATVTTVEALSKKTATDTTHLYRVTGTAQYAGYAKKGYFDFSDNGYTIIVYGCTASNSSITRSGSTYTFANNDSFVSTGIKAGDTVTLEGVVTFYSYTSSYGIPEFMCYPTKIIHNNLSSPAAKSYTTAETYTGTYYDSIASTVTGASLGTALHNLMMSTHTTYVSYSSLDSTLKTTDGNGSKINCFYSGASSSSFNKEHVWPQAKSKDGSVQLYGTSYAGADINHVRAAISTNNSYRGSSMFAPVFGSTKTISYTTGGQVKFGSGNYYGVTEPADSMKGDVARIIMYVFTHYGTDFGGTVQSGVTGKLYITGVIGADSISGCFNILRKWSAEDPVSAVEIARNNLAFSIQGNRNPFIDHPSFADRIWG